MSTIGFIILRHVNSVETNEYWMYSYDCIRRFYKDNLIVIIDDASDDTFLTHKEMHNTFVLKSEFPKRGELLPYYYYAKYKFERDKNKPPSEDLIKANKNVVVPAGNGEGQYE